MLLALQAAYLCSGASAAPPPLQVTGSEIVTDSGCTLVLKGVNVDGLEYSSGGYSSGWPGNIVGVAQMAVTGWNCNVIRLPLNQDYWFGCGGANQATYQGMVNNIVNFCSTNNVYVLLDLHWSGTYSGTSPSSPCSGGGWGTATGQQVMPDANAITFWGALASTFANNPAVLFDLYNEPHGVLWPTWQSGGSTGNTPAWTPGMQTLLNTVRSAGATNICVLGGLQWCQDFSGLGSYPVTGFNIAYAAHLYGNQVGNTIPGWNSKVGPATVKGPIFIGEMAPNTACNTDDSTYDANMFSWIGSPAIAGGTAWSMTTNSCPNLLSSSTTSYPTSPWGSAVTNWLATPPPNCVFTNTPTPTVTPCGYPGNTCTPTDTPTATSTPTATYTPNPNAEILWPNPWNGSQPVSVYHNLPTAPAWVHLKVYTLAFRKIYEDDSLSTDPPQQVYSLSWNQLGNVADGLYYVVIEEKRGKKINRTIFKLLIRR